MNEKELMDELNATDGITHHWETRLFDAVIVTPKGDRFLITHLNWDFDKRQVQFVAAGLPSGREVA